MKRARLIAYAFASCLVPGAAHAQSALPQTPAPPPGWVAPPMYAPYGYPTVPIQLDVTEPNVDVLVFPPNGKVDRDAPIVRCSGECVVNLVPGRYKIYVTETDSTVSGSRTLELRGPTRLVLDPDTRQHRTAGLALGIAGPIMIVAGFAAVLSQICIECDHPKENNPVAVVGVFGILGGLVATPVGWVMFGTSFKPEYDLQPLASPGYGRVPPALATAPVGGPGLQWRMTF